MDIPADIETRAYAALKLPQAQFAQVAQEGDANIYANTRDVFEPPAGNISAPKFEDDRGIILRIPIPNSKETINALVTYKGHMRSGDLHKNVQYDQILAGKIELWTYVNNKTVKQVYESGALIAIPPHVPHLFNFLEDTLMMEWWGGSFKAWYYKPYRDIIDENTKKVRAAAQPR